MFKTREQIEQDEAHALAPYAVKGCESLGRRFPEAPHPYRTAFQRDRGRIIHSAAFRRLDGKTQVFLNGSGDHYRTRLTHTIEVASISRTIARALSVNEDLCEVIALAHDLGHPPFGHSGEETLNRLMRDHGGFDHNIQSLRIVSALEELYPRFYGLNLTFEVLEGLQKHGREYRLPGGESYPCPSIEAQIADLADEIAYHSHDLDDGISSGLVNAGMLDSIEIWSSAREQAEREFSEDDQRPRRNYIIRCIVSNAVEDLVAASSEAIAQSGVRTVDDVRRQPQRMVRFSDRLQRQNEQLREFLFSRLYHHPDVANVHRRNTKILESFFTQLVNDPSRLGSRAPRWIAAEGLHRAVADYLAGMTDHYCIERCEAMTSRASLAGARPAQHGQDVGFGDRDPGHGLFVAED